MDGGASAAHGRADPEAVASTTATLAENAAHLARALTATPYPGS
jgi:hypothetical protein